MEIENNNYENNNVIIGDLNSEVCRKFSDKLEKLTKEEKKELSNSVIPELIHQSFKIVNELDSNVCGMFSNISYYASKELSQKLSNEFLPGLILNSVKIAKNVNSSVCGMVNNIFCDISEEQKKELSNILALKLSENPEKLLNNLSNKSVCSMIYRIKKNSSKENLQKLSNALLPQLIKNPDKIVSNLTDSSFCSIILSIIENISDERKQELSNALETQLIKNLEKIFDNLSADNCNIICSVIANSSSIQSQQLAKALYNKILEKKEYFIKILNYDETDNKTNISNLLLNITEKLSQEKKENLSKVFEPIFNNQTSRYKAFNTLQDQLKKINLNIKEGGELEKLKKIQTTPQERYNEIINSIKLKNKDINCENLVIKNTSFIDILLAIAEKKYKIISTLNFSENKLSKEILNQLVETIKHKDLKSVETLNLSKVNLSELAPESFKIILNKANKLILDNCKLTEQQVLFISNNIVKSNNIEEISLKDNNIEQESMKNIVSQIGKTKSLKVIKLDNIDTTSLLENNNNRKLETLIINDSKIENEKLLNKVFSNNRRISTLNLSNCNIEDTQISKIICFIIDNKLKVKELGLSKNFAGTETIKTICQYVEKGKLIAENIDLSNNKISEDEALRLYTSINKNLKKKGLLIKKINLIGNDNITEETKTDIKRLLEKRNTNNNETDITKNNLNNVTQQVQPKIVVSEITPSAPLLTEVQNITDITQSQNNNVVDMNVVDMQQEFISITRESPKLTRASSFSATNNLYPQINIEEDNNKELVTQENKDNRINSAVTLRPKKRKDKVAQFYI